MKTIHKMNKLEERAYAFVSRKLDPALPCYADLVEDMLEEYKEIATEQKAIDEEQAGKMLVALTAKILEPLGAGLPSCYYEAMENWTIEGIAEIAVQLIKNTRAMEED